MNRTLHPRFLRWFAGFLLLALMVVGRPATAQPYGEPRYDRPALDAMLAPIALYPDPLLSHVLMAATYPREVQEAARWLRDRPGLSGDAAVRASEGWDWDPSVRSLLAFPQVLQTLADYPRWTEDLGDAFLVQREDVMDTIQQLRRRALAAGTLRSTESTRVLDHGYAITIEPVTPQTVYVPYYDPRVTYGTWWWPARPPMYWSRWPGYYAPPGRDLSVYWGPGIHLGGGFFFGNFVWGRREVRVVDVRPYYYPRSMVIERQVVPGRPIIEHRPSVPDVWRHDARRRFDDDRRDFSRREGRPPEPPRPAVIAPRVTEDRGPPARSEPRDDRRGDADDRRGFGRRDRDDIPPPGARIAPAPRAPEAVMAVPNQPSAAATRPDGRDPRMDRGNRDRDDARMAPRPDARGERRSDDAGIRRSAPPAAERSARPPEQAAPRAQPQPNANAGRRTKQENTD